MFMLGFEHLFDLGFGPDWHQELRESQEGAPVHGHAKYGLGVFI